MNREDEQRMYKDLIRDHQNASRRADGTGQREPTPQELMAFWNRFCDLYRDSCSARQRVVNLYARPDGSSLLTVNLHHGVTPFMFDGGQSAFFRVDDADVRRVAVSSNSVDVFFYRPTFEEFAAKPLSVRAHVLNGGLLAKRRRDQLAWSLVESMRASKRAKEQLERGLVLETEEDLPKPVTPIQADLWQRGTTEFTHGTLSTPESPDTLAKFRFHQAVGEKMAEIYEEHSRDAGKELEFVKRLDREKTQRESEILADQIRALFCAQLGELSQFPSLTAVVLTNPMTRLLDGVSQADVAVTL